MNKYEKILKLESKIITDNLALELKLKKIFIYIFVIALIIIVLFCILFF